MPTKTAPTVATAALEATVVPLDRRPATAAATQTLAALRQQQLELETTLKGALTEVDPIRAAEGRLLALTLEPQRLQLRADIGRAELAAEAARDADTLALREELMVLKRRAVAALVPAMREAHERMCELQRLETLEHQYCGFVDRHAWPSLGTNDAGASFLGEWLYRLKLAGLLM